MLSKKLLTLAVELRLHESQVRADLQQYYGIDIDHARAGVHSPHHIACLLVEMPIDARTRIEENKDAQWTLNNVLMASVFNSINSLMYGLSDPKKRGNPPDLLGPSWLTEKRKNTIPARVMTASELLEILNMPRG